MLVIRLCLCFMLMLIGCGVEQQHDEKSEIIVEDFTIPSTNNVQLFVRSFSLGNAENASNHPLLLIHGGGPGGVASFDLDVNNGSFAKELTKRGLKVYLMNVRGWEKSTLPSYDFSDSSTVVGSYLEATEDIHSAITFICEKEKLTKVSIFGWATGGHWAGNYAAKYSDKLANFISLNALYGVKAPWELRKFFQQASDTTKFNKTGFFRTSNKEGLVRKWTATIPVAEKDSWRDALVMEAYRSTAVSFGEDSTVMTVPGGYREESFYMSLGKKYWDASTITCPTLVLRSDLDFWSRPEDLQGIDKDLVNCSRKKVKQIKGTHYVFLDKPERGRSALVDEIIGFIGAAD